MFIELKFRLTQDCLAALKALDLSGPEGGWTLPTKDESVRVAIEFCADDEALLASIAPGSARERRVHIIVASGLVTATASEPEASTLASRLLKHSWSNGTLVGLVGIAQGEKQHVPGLDCVISDRPFDPRALREAIQKVASRAWFKLPPPVKDKHSGRKDVFEVQEVTRQDHFRQSLELRRRVYDALGYVDERIASAELKIELDCYDPRAIHYVVASGTDPHAVVGTMRIIMPSCSKAGSPLIGFRRYEEWCEELANAEPSRVFRDLLNRPFSNSLPLFDSFRYFPGLTERDPFRDMIQARHSCEVSRIVVHPDFRGYGILKLLMDKAIEVASRGGKRYMLLECAPFHEAMYRKYGFQVIEDQGKRYYARAQRLDTWAVAMYLDLRAHQVPSVPLDAAPPDNLYRLPVADRRRRQYTLTIGCNGLDRREIDARLSLPYRMRAATAPRGAYVAKGAEPALGSLIRCAFIELDACIGEFMREIFRRLPEARIRLVASDGQELVIDEPQCQSRAGSLPLHDVLSKWLEENRGSA